jgi:hypothetical protein
MCNASNHPFGCTCGFGGDTGGSGLSQVYNTSLRGLGGSATPPFDFSQGLAFERYIDPNARCPVCGVSVFFYQSPYGGRVFFDALGPPWPKHPCTDSLLTSMGGIRRLPEPVVSRSSNAMTSWLVNGWIPINSVEIDHGVRPLSRRQGGRYTVVSGYSLVPADAGKGEVSNRFTGWPYIDVELPVLVRLDEYRNISQMTYFARTSRSEGRMGTSDGLALVRTISVRSTHLPMPAHQALSGFHSPGHGKMRKAAIGIVRA